MGADRPAPETAPPAKSVLVFRVGAIGDTLVALPALRAIRRHFAGARVDLLCDVRARGARYVPASDMVRGAGVADGFVQYPTPRTTLGRRLRPLNMLLLAIRLRLARYDALVYLAPSGRTRGQVERDRAFFRLAGIRQLYGMDVSLDLPPRAPDGRLPAVRREMDLLLERLTASGIPAPKATPETIAPAISGADQSEVDAWLVGLPADGGRPWVAIGPGSKVPSKLWPADRFREVVARLIDRYDVWPVIFGDASERAVGEQLLAAWGRGYNAAGTLGLGAAFAALRRARLYLGNDTGTMHMAAAVGVRCVGVYAARDYPGLWSPAGEGHVAIRADVSCAGCMLDECVERRLECLTRVGVDEVYDACARVLGEVLVTGRSSI